MFQGSDSCSEYPSSRDRNSGQQCRFEARVAAPESPGRDVQEGPVITIARFFPYEITIFRIAKKCIKGSKWDGSSLNITRDEKPFGIYRYLGKKKLSDVPDTVEHHARQVSGERESAGGEP